MTRSHLSRLALAALVGVAGHGSALAQALDVTFDDLQNGWLFYSHMNSTSGLPDLVVSAPNATGLTVADFGDIMQPFAGLALRAQARHNEALRLNFLNGATGALSMDVALNPELSPWGLAWSTVKASAYDAQNRLISSATFSADHTRSGGGEIASDYPLTRVSLDLGGTTAAYALMNFIPPTLPTGPSDVPNDVLDTGGGAELPLELRAPTLFFVDNLKLTLAGSTPLPSFMNGGLNADDPVLPLVARTNLFGNTSYEFGLLTYGSGVGRTQMRFIDPEVAVGYDYEVRQGANFASVLVPAALAHGDDTFALVIDGVGSFELKAGQEFDITAVVAGGVNRFRIEGIDPGAALDPNNPQAFVTGLTFVEGGWVDLTQSPITATVAVPEPATYALWLGGLGALALRRRARRAA